MPTRPRCLRLCLATAIGLLLAAGAQAQGEVYRCGNSYSAVPCAGGTPVAVDDARTADQRQQAAAAKRQDAQLARQLAAERRARERAAVGQQAVRIGPSAAERAAADAAEAQAKAAAERRRADRKSGDKPPQRRRLGAA